MHCWSSYVQYVTEVRYTASLTSASEFLILQLPVHVGQINGGQIFNELMIKLVLETIIFWR
jgi:hypothetical protein